MSKLAHSNQETMDQIERDAENAPDEGSAFATTKLSCVEYQLEARLFAYDAMFFIELDDLQSARIAQESARAYSDVARQRLLSLLAHNHL